MLRHQVTTNISSYRMLFLVSTLLRLGNLLLAVRIRETDSHGIRHVVSQLIRATPLRLIHFPVGLFRINTPDDADEEQPSATRTA